MKDITALLCWGRPKQYQKSLLYLCSLIKEIVYRSHKFLGFCIFSMMASQWDFSRGIALHCIALLLAAHAKGQESVPVTWAVDVATKDNSHHLGSICWSPIRSLPWTGLSVAQLHPILDVVCFRRASSHASQQHSSAQCAPSWLQRQQCSASPHRQRDHHSPPETCLLFHFHSPRTGLAFLAKVDSGMEVHNFVLPPPFPPPNLWTSWCPGFSWDRVGWFHQLWSARWRSQSLLSSFMFGENLLRT